jgi:manganese/zinc/iron transport system permease protein
MEAFWIILTGALVAACCGLLGCFLVLRRMAMVGDAISHAVLPGIVISFMVSGSRESIPMLIGAGLLGVFTTFMIEFLHKRARVQTDASIGVTFTCLFALGVILVSYFAGNVDLDLDCVLYGEIAYVPLDLWVTAGGLNMGPRTVWILGVVTVIVVLFVVLGYKELFLTTFDPAFAAAVGFSTGLWYYLLMGAVSLTTVATFESVGAILVVAFLVAPPATAYLLTDNLKAMLMLSVGLGVFSATAGYFLAYWLDGSIAGAIATVAGGEFLLAFLWSPLHGLFRQKKTVSPLAPVEGTPLFK